MAALHARCFGETPPPWSERGFRAMLATPGVLVMARDGGLAIVQVAGPEAELLTICVDPDAQRRGLGRALLADALARAAESGAVEIFLEVAASNAPARALYAAAGFSGAGVRPGYYRPAGGDPVDALILRRALDARAAPAIPH